jgi:quinol monooxygenase YgiN
LVVFVHVHVKPECIEQFKALSLDNASNSIQEPGVARFDVVQNAEDATRFVLIEAYRTPDAPAKHKETAHYARWRDGVADIMAEPRSAVKYESIFLPD